MRPSEEYTIHVLEDEDFDMLPVGHPKQALGMSDPKRKIAWVRRTHIKEFDMETINHEFDEMMAKTSFHEIDGIRYKGLIAALVNFIKGVATAVKAGGAISAVGSAGKAAGAGIALGKGLVAAAPIVGSALASKGVSNTLATGNPFSSGAAAAAQNQGRQPQQTQLPGFAPQQATAAFSPSQAAATAQSPLSEIDFAQGLSNIDANRLSQRGDVFSRFRGLGNPSENTAFSRALSNVDTSSASTRQQFISDQEERKRLVGFG
jgi:hypothetical protein